MFRCISFVSILLLALYQPCAAQESSPLESLKVCKGPIGGAGPPRFTQNPALNCPDEFAWDLFAKLNHPAKRGERGMPDPSKKLGEPSETVWETWKLRSEVLLSDGCRPSGWEEAPAIAAARLMEPASKIDRAFMSVGSASGPVPMFDPARPRGETRLNKAAFDFIVANELYNVDGQLVYHKSKRAIDLPPEAREIKSAWRPLGSHEDRNRFHSVEHDGKVWGLIALHIITKDIPQWFWSTFEHIDNPGLDIRRGTRFADRHTNGGVNLPPEIENTKWTNYRLKGTQVEYVDLTGEPTILANEMIENGFQNTSSCITCHARAVIGSDGARLPIWERVVGRRLIPSNEASKDIAFFTGNVGAPNPTWFNGPNMHEVLFTQLDFMWSLAFVQKKGACSQ